LLRDEDTENGRLSVTLPAPYLNRILNPSMEKDDDYLSGVADGWTAEENLNPVGATDYQVYTVDSPGSAAAGRRVQRMHVQGNTNAGQMAVKQEVDLPGTMLGDEDITLAFSYRNCACANRELWLEYRELDSGGSPVTARSVKLNPSLEWNRTSLTFEKSSPIHSVEVKLILKVTETGQDAWAEFDAVQLFYGARDTAFNDVENASFDTWEDDYPAGWSIDNDNYLKPGIFTPYDLIMDGDNYATQTVKVKPNTRYLFFVRLLVQSAGEGEGARVSCGGQYACEGSVRGYLGGNDYCIGDAGTPGVPDVPATAFKIIDSGDATTLEIKLELCAGDYTQATFYDVSLTEMPQDVTTSYDSRGNYANEVTAPSADGDYSTSYVTTDPVGNVRKARDARSSGPTDNTYCFTYSYNELSQLTSLVSPLVHDAEGEEIQAYTADYDHYDKAGRLLWLLDNNGEETSYEYNDLGQVTEKTDPNSRTVQVEYNEAGGVKKVTYPDPDGPNNPLLSWEVYYSYRSNGTLDKVAFRDPQGTVTNPYTFTYDGAGRMTQVSDSVTGITLNFTFDKASRLLTSASSYAGGFTSSYAYTKAGRLTSLGYSKSGWGSGTQVTYAYRGTGEQSTLALPNSYGSISYAYDDRGRLSTLHNTVPAHPDVSHPTSLTYDAAGRVASVSSAFADSGSLVTYEYDAIGNVTCMVRGNVRNLYAYDELCRLTSWTEKTGGIVTRSEKYYYDGGGNITSVDTLGADETHAYDAANQCTDTGFTHDVCGNLTSDGEWDYAYERGSRLASATNDTQNIKLVFGYDPRGRRYSKTAYERDGQGQYTVQKYAIYYHYDAGGNVLAETDAAGGLIRSYAYDLSGHPVAMTQDLGAGQKTFFLHSNARGDIICITDENMNWAKRFTYDPWGKVISETASSSAYEALACPYAYAGYFRDVETGLYYMPARYYSPFQRRFLTKDPHPGSKGSPITLNPYQYCGNNPINSVDPTGQYDFSFSLDCSGMNAYFNQMAADNAARSQAMSRILGGFVSAMSNFRASVQSSMANIGGLSAKINSAVNSINSAFYQINMAIAMQKVGSALSNALRPHGPINTGIHSKSFLEKLFTPSNWSWGFSINLVVLNVGYSNKGGWFGSGGLNWPLWGGDVGITYDPNPDNNAGGTTVGGSGYYGGGGGIAYEPGTGDWRFTFGVGTPGLSLEGDRWGD
jgi:RHS repeat-associated protein